ncbi:tripartite tricarboxylate transporter substrate binding protein [Rhodovarius sp.]|jgi:tripartite-type tricarboxylate transporter receptor subunit TctC|uniref:Bug family tripartite tricarboxylate transporter substrate binding protein n=1 Tax=Rhodovarius sp. TaxID=2972673 RepID=UPI00333EE6AB
MATRRSLFAAALATPALAQSGFPNRPLRMIIPVGVAGATDIVGRIVAEHMAQLLGRPVVCENIAGAGSTIAAAAFQRTAPDGYTIFIGTNNHPVMQAIRRDFPFNPITDFVPFSLVARQPSVLAVSPDVPARDVAELMAWLRARGDAVNYGSTFPGATNHLAGELMKHLARVNFTIVPYRTAALAVQDLVAGRVDLTIDSPMMLAPLIREGRLRGLAVSGAERTDLLPGLPTLMESGVPGYELTAWQALFVRPGTPPEALAVLTDVAKRTLEDPGVRERLRQNSAEVWPDSSPAAAAAHLRAEVERWGPLVANMGIAN